MYGLVLMIMAVLYRSLRFAKGQKQNGSDDVLAERSVKGCRVCH